MNLSNPFLALVLAGAAGGWILPGRAEAASPDATPKRAVVAPVTVSVVERKPVPLELRTFGMVEPVATVAIKSQITGLLTTVLIKEGQEVR